KYEVRSTNEENRFSSFVLRTSYFVLRTLSGGAAPRESGDLQLDELLHDGGSSRPLPRTVGQQTLDEGGQRGRQVGDTAANVGRGIAAMTAKRLPERAGRIRQTSREHLEEHHSQAEQIAAQILGRQRIALFRRQVVGRSQHIAGPQE